MVRSGSVTPALPRETSPPATADREPWGRIAARLLAAVAASAMADTLWWLHQPRRLTGPIDIVGYPTWANYDYVPSFLGYRLITYAFPLGVLLGYSLLAWRGPLRRPARARRHRADERMPGIPAAEPAAGPVDGPALAVAARLLLPAGVVAVAASTGSAHHDQRISAAGLLYGLAYLAGVLGLAAAIAWRRGRPGPLRWAQVRPAIPAVNGVFGAMASVAALWYVSQHSIVAVESLHRVQHWPWLPGWLAAAGMLAIAAWAGLRLRGGRAALAVESRLLAVVVGAVTVFLITWQMLGQLGRFHGFDDAQSLAGANLLGKGYFPWRDQMFIHGLGPDALQSTLGFGVFGDTRWGSVVGGTVLLDPACWVILYLFAAWFSRRNRWFLAVLALPLLAGILDPPTVRFIVVPVVLVLLGEVLARRSFGWCAAFMVAVVSQAILVPETVFLALPALLVVVAADLTHRSPGTKVWPALRRTYWCAAAGAVLLAAWCAFLAANHALGAWIEYFKVVGPSHDAEGAIPPVHLRPQDWAEFGLGIALVLITFWAAVARVRGGRSWSARDWVTVAAAGFVALYGEKALGRFDSAHIAEVFTATLPLALLWLEEALTTADRLARARAPGARSPAPGTGPSRGVLAARNPATVLAMAVIVLVTLPGGRSPLARAWDLPARAHAMSATAPAVPRLGYVTPGAFDLSLLRDLGTALDTYAGRNGSVFDMTNSLGYVYYLLDRTPASRFTHIDMANTPYAMQLIIDDLQRSRPPVVIFDSTSTGLPGWDDIANNIRHYLVSQYLLRGWTPVLRTHGELLLLRNDLMAGRPPAPRLSAPAQSAGLWFSSAACNWGSIPDFLSSPASGSSVQVPVGWQGPRAVTRVRGWAVQTAGQAPLRTVVLAAGRKVLAAVRPGAPRAAGVGRKRLRSRFAAQLIRPAGGGPVTVYALTADGTLHPLAGQPSPLAGGVLRLPDGTSARIGAAVRGHVVIRTKTFGVAHIPAGVTLASYALLTLHARGTIGPSEITISDRPAGGNANHDIVLHALPSPDESLGVRVGSCMQWHGYQSRTLYVTQTGGGAPIDLLQLSGVG